MMNTSHCFTSSTTIPQQHHHTRRPLRVSPSSSIIQHKSIHPYGSLNNHFNNSQQQQQQHQQQHFYEAPFILRKNNTSTGDVGNSNNNNNNPPSGISPASSPTNPINNNNNQDDHNNSTTTLPYFDTTNPAYIAFATTMSGGISNVVSRTVIAPLERTRLQMAIDPNRYTSMIDCMKQISKEEGFGKLWRGNMLNVLRIFPQGGLSFLVKDWFKVCLPQNIRENSNYSGYIATVSGILAGVVGMTVVYPLDYIRMRMTCIPGAYPNWYKGLQIMAKQEGGIPALYKGVMYSNYWAGIYYLSQFYSYDTMKYWYLNYAQKDISVDDAPKILDERIALLFGSISGCICVTIAYPLEAIRRKLQVQGIGGRPILHKGVLDCGNSTFKQYGIRGLYKGLGANLCKAPLSLGITFGLYEFCMNRLFGVGTKKQQNATKV